MKINGMILDKKPMQSEKINSVKVARDAGRMAQGLFEQALYIATVNYANQHNKKILLKYTDIKGADRIEAKSGDQDIGGDCRKILDIVRATVVFETIEDVLDFVGTMKNTSFDKKTFDGFMNGNIANNFVSVERYSRNAHCENVIPKDCSSHFESISGMKKIDTMNAYTRNGFYLSNVSDEYIANLGLKKGKTKGKVLGESERRATNYMDMKFYVPIPTKKYGTFYCEVIATVKAFDDVYADTHVILEKTRDPKMLSDFVEAFNPYSKEDVLENSEKSIIFRDAMENLLKKMVYDIHKKQVDGYNKDNKGKIRIDMDSKFSEKKNNVINKASERLMKAGLEYAKVGLNYKIEERRYYNMLFDARLKKDDENWRKHFWDAFMHRIDNNRKFNLLRSCFLILLFIEKKSKLSNNKSFNNNAFMKTLLNTKKVKHF